MATGDGQLINDRRRRGGMQDEHDVYVMYV